MKMAPYEAEDPEAEACRAGKSEVETREDRLNEQHEKCDRIIQYLRHGKHLDGLSKNQQRVVRGQAKNYIWDETSKVTFPEICVVCCRRSCRDLKYESLSCCIAAWAHVLDAVLFTVILQFIMKAMCVLKSTIT